LSSLKVSSKTRWINAIPIRVNVDAWKVRLDCLPRRLSISQRGMDIDSILCPNCGNEVESTSHIFFVCSLAKEVGDFDCLGMVLIFMKELRRASPGLSDLKEQYGAVIRLARVRKSWRIDLSLPVEDQGKTSDKGWQMRESRGLAVDPWMTRTLYGPMSGSDKQLPLNRQEHTTQNELFMEISVDLQLTIYFSCLEEFFFAKLFLAVEVSLKVRSDGFMQGSSNEHKRKMVDYEEKKQRS
ncbi:RNA-directed DNA polymerase, eukaryota, partial [Tanacetum coccineum]